MLSGSGRRRATSPQSARTRESVMEGGTPRSRRKSRLLPGERLDDLCPEPLKIRETRCEVVRHVVELAGDMRQPHRISAALQALATILVVARDGPFRGIGTEGEPERHGAWFLHRPFMVAAEGQEPTL